MENKKGMVRLVGSVIPNHCFAAGGWMRRQEQGDPSC